MKPWPALWPPTLATKSQKPRPERWPLTDPSLPLCAALPTQPASGQRLVASLCSQQTAVSSLPTSCLPLKQIARASHPFRARLPQSKALVQPSQLCPQAENISATPSVEIAAALATMAHRSKLLQPSAPRRPQADTKSACGSQARATLGSSQCSCDFHAANASATQLAPAAALG